MKMSREGLKLILENHKKLLNGNENGKRANFNGADLRGADLINADLRGAYLSNAYLRGAYLSNANLSNADLRGAYLSNANLSNADLSNADLRGAYLINANLINADLRGAYLINANLINADLSNADLRGAYLINANLINADLRGADLNGAKNIFLPINCPEMGEFIAYKKAANNTIVKLKIPKDAKRSSATTRKCRCDKAIVLAIEYIDGRQYESKSVRSNYDKSFIYTVGEEVSVPDFDENRWNECSTGIHFFITRQEAVQY